MFKPVRLALIAAAVAVAVPAGGGLAAEQSWDGTWVGGFEMNKGAQIVVAGEQAIGLYWHDDYVLGLRSSVEADGTLTLAWDSGRATLTRTGAKAADASFQDTDERAVKIHLQRE